MTAPRSSSAPAQLRQLLLPACVAVAWVIGDPVPVFAATGEEGIMATVFRLANFAILAGTLVYFL
jgi:hypothetical protein